MPLVVITAWEGLADHARVQACQQALLHCGAGGVGHIAVQIARAFGAQAFATGSGAQKDVIEGYGATAIDYRAVEIDEYVP